VRQQEDGTAFELAQLGIRTNTVYPGYTVTNLID